MDTLTPLDILYISLSFAAIVSTIVWCAFLIKVTKNLSEIIKIIKSVLAVAENVSNSVKFVKGGIKHGALTVVQLILESLASTISTGGDKNGKKSK